MTRSAVVSCSVVHASSSPSIIPTTVSDESLGRAAWIMSNETFVSSATSVLIDWFMNDLLLGRRRESLRELCRLVDGQAVGRAHSRQAVAEVRVDEVVGAGAAAVDDGDRLSPGAPLSRRDEVLAAQPAAVVHGARARAPELEVDVARRGQSDGQPLPPRHPDAVDVLRVLDV